MTASEERAHENELLDEGRAEAANEWLAEAIQQYFRDGTLAELVVVLAKACELRAALPEISEAQVKKWGAAAMALDLVAEEDEIKNVP